MVMLQMLGSCASASTFALSFTRTTSKDPAYFNANLPRYYETTCTMADRQCLAEGNGAEKFASVALSNTYYNLLQDGHISIWDVLDWM